MTRSLKIAVVALLAATPLMVSADPGRADQAKDDARRHGPEILAFAGVKPGDDHSKAVFDKAIRDRTDQFIYKFRKPG